MSKLWISATAVAILWALGVFFYKARYEVMPTPVPSAQLYNTPSATPVENPPSTLAPDAPVAELPPEVNLDVSFTSQAPRQNWDLPYQEFCEEASVLMAASYIKGEAISGPDYANEKLLAIKDFEEKRFGYYKDTTAEETAIILREFYGLPKVKVVYEPTVANIKSALANGQAVLAPAAGRRLGNPYFQQPGPLYHMLVIRGYTKNGYFITNDPGTRRGNGYIYSPDKLINAIHDWNNGDVENGRRVVIVVG